MEDFLWPQFPDYEGKLLVTLASVLQGLFPI